MAIPSNRAADGGIACLPSTTYLREDNRRRQIETLETWFQIQKLAGGVPVALDLAGLKKMIYDWAEQYYELHPPG